MKKMINRKILILISLLLFLPLLVGCFLFPSANQSPTITSTPITTATVGEEYTYDVEATDPDSGDTLTYSLTTSPTGMNINSITGVINWAPTSAQIGDYNVTVEVSDGSLSDTQSFIIVVSEAPPAPPAPPTPVAVTGVTLDQATMTLTAGGATGTLVATVAPANATNKSVTWSSSTPAVATVASGVVTPVTAGTTTITVTTVDGGKTATCAVTVNPETPVAVTGVTLNQATMTLTAGGATGTLVATVAPANATNKSVIWSSSTPAVAFVVTWSGVVTPLTAGTTTITVTTVDGGKTATCAVTVNPAAVAVGDSYGGGIVVYIDGTGQHGLIAATVDQSDGIAWITGGSTQTTLNGNTSTDLGTGATNTAAIIAQAVAALNGDLSTYAAGVCDNYTNTETGTGVYSDWFLPSKDELNKLDDIGGFADYYYWSSSEFGAFYALAQNFISPFQGGSYKDSTYRVRAVRAF